MTNSATEFHVLADPHRGCERFIEATVRLSDEPSQLPILDRKGQERFDKYIAGRSFIAVKGILTAVWKSEADRELCKTDQSNRGRWEGVQRCKAGLLAGDKLPPSVFLHPSITGRSDSLLVPVDGARRLMAQLEAGLLQVPVIVVCAQDACPRTAAVEPCQ